MVMLVVSTLGAILISGICSIAEATLLSLNPIRLETLKQQGHSYAATLLRMKEQVDRPIAAILILNTIANTGGAVIAGDAFGDVFGTEWLWLFTTFFALAILYVSEIIPKIAGVVYSEHFARWIAWFLVGAILLLWPLIIVTETLARAIRGKNEQDEARLSIMDVLTMARLARASKVIGTTEETIIMNAVQLGQTTVQTVMIPREHIIFLKQMWPISANLQTARDSLHTRYPVSATESVDDIIGYINFKELVLTPNLETVRLDTFVRPMLVVPPEIRLSTLFRRLIAGRHHVILVKDDAGQVVGMVTLEDVIEEIVGDIQDELDNIPSTIIPIDANTWNVGGGVLMQTLASYCDIPLDETAAALPVTEWLQSRLGARAQTGLTYRNGQTRFTIRRIRRGRIHYVKVECGDE